MPYTTFCRRPPFARQLPGAAFLLSAVLLLSGCAMARLAYDNAGRLLMTQIDSYLDLNDAQGERTRAALDARLAVHRRDELVPTAVLLERTAQALDSALTPATAEQLAQDARAQFELLADRSLPVLLTALAELEPRQIDRLQARFAKNARKYREERRLDGTRGERLAARQENMVERIEAWTGRLDAGQLALLRKHLPAMADSASTWASWRDQRQAALVALLRERPSAPALDAELRASWLKMDAAPRALIAARDTNVEVFLRLLVDLSASLSPRQRERAAGRLRGYAEDARVLAARAS